VKLESVIGALPAAHAAAAPAAGAGSLLSLIGSLVLVLGAIFALAFVARFLQRARAGGSGGALQLHAGIQVGPKERVVLLQVGGEHFMVGVAPGCVTLLHKFMSSPLAPEARGTVIPFAERLRQVLHRDAANAP
jgi:flagellar protein FliO/FliZ